eukprot:UN13488
MKLVQIPSDSKLIELLSLRLNNSLNNNPIIMSQNKHMHTNNNDLYSQQIYYYLNIQINDNECIHVRIYSKNGNTNVQAILYKGTLDKLRQF